MFTYTAFSPENEEKVKSALESEIARLRSEGVTADEVRKAIAYSVGEHEIRLQSRSAQAVEYARAIYSGAGADSVGKYSDLIRQVTPEQLKIIAQQYMDPANARIAIVRGQ